MKKYIIGITALVTLVLIRVLWVVLDSEDEVVAEEPREVEVVEAQQLSISVVGCVTNPTVIPFKDGEKLIDVFDYKLLKSSYSSIELETQLYKPLKDKTVFEIKCRNSVYFTGCLLEEKQVYFEAGQVVNDVIDQVNLREHYSPIKYDAIKYDILKSGKNVEIECKKSTTVSGAVVQSKVIYFEDGQKVKDVVDQFEVTDDVDLILYDGIKNTVISSTRNLVIPEKRTFYINGLTDTPLAFKYTEGDDISMYLEDARALASCNRFDEVPFRKATIITEGQVFNIRCLIQVSFTGEVAEERNVLMTKGEALSTIKAIYDFSVKKATSDSSNIDWTQKIYEDTVIVIEKA